MPLDHSSLVVPKHKVEPLITFLTTSLAHMGFHEVVRPVPNVVGLGERAPYFWIDGEVPADVDEKSIDSLLKKLHFAFTAENAEQVRQFHAKALEAGATCNGPPGLRTHYHPKYYGAFVLDPVCGINFEMVCKKGDS